MAAAKVTEHGHDGRDAFNSVEVTKANFIQSASDTCVVHSLESCVSGHKFVDKEALARFNVSHRSVREDCVHIVIESLSHSRVEHLLPVGRWWSVS